MSNNEMNNLIENSFFRHVPALMAKGMDFDTAVTAAYEQEEAFLLEMQMQTTERSQRAKEGIRRSL